MEKTLVYIGANVGDNLSYRILSNDFTKVIAFEPDPQIFEILQNRFSNDQSILNKCSVTLVNAACSSNNGVGTLYVFSNRVSTSLGNPNFELDKPNIIGEVKVHTINLFDFLNENNVSFIDLLITDCQGSDLEIIKTLSPLLDSQNIKEIICETHRDDFDPYNGLNNHFCEFQKILNKNYKVIEFLSDCGSTIHVPNNLEWDTHWMADKFL